MLLQNQRKILYLHLVFKNDSVAQLVEHIPFKDGVLGSRPSGITETIVNRSISGRFFLCCHECCHIELLSLVVFLTILAKYLYISQSTDDRFNRIKMIIMKVSFNALNHLQSSPGINKIGGANLNSRGSGQ